MSDFHQHGGDVFAAARSLGLAPEALVDFSASINPLGMAPGVKAALGAALDRLMHYPDKGAQECRETLAAYHGIAPEQIAVANGSTELIHLLPRLVPGRRALIVAPAFAEYAAGLARAGWSFDYLTLSAADGFRLCLDALAQRLEKGYDLLFLCTPGNPTGAALSRPELDRLLALCTASRTFLALDEAFVDFCEELSAKETMISCPGGIILRSMTKFFAIPGLRLGYAIGHRETVAALAGLQDPWSVNTAAQVAGIASLADPAYRDETRRYVAQQRERLSEGLNRLGWLEVFPSRANYLLVRIADGRTTATKLRQRLMRHGVLIRDCSNFEGLDRSFFRVAVRLERENDRLVELLRGE